jgi:oxygen-dependent protoporphyrinogen oxidase
VKIAVVGAGVSGLVCALRAQQAGHEVVVFERSATVGGRMASAHPGGRTVDVGANLLLLDRYTRLRAVADEVGLGETLFAFEPGGRGGILEDGDVLHLAPTTVADLVRAGGLSWGARVRLLRWALRAWRGADDLDFFDLSAGDDALDGEDAWAGLVDVCGEEVVRKLVDPFVRTFHFHGAGRLSRKAIEALAALFVGGDGGFVTGGFRGQMEALPRAIAAHLDVRLGVEVTSVTTCEGGVAVEAVGAGGPAVFDRVVLATTASVARRIWRTPTVVQADVLDAVDYAPTVVCSFVVPEAASGKFEGIWVPFSESAMICNCANEACKGATDGVEAVLSFGLHEEAARWMMSLSDEAISALVANEWARLMPACRGRMTPLHVQRWPEAIPVYGPGDLTRVARFWRHGQGDGGVWLCGDWLNHPWLEGSVRCGERVAAALAGGGV